MPQTYEPESPLIPPTEAAKRLNIHPKTLRRIRQRGDIEYVRVSPARVKYRPAVIDAYIRKQTVVERARRGTSKPRRQA